MTGVMMRGHGMVFPMPMSNETCGVPLAIKKTG